MCVWWHSVPSFFFTFANVIFLSAVGNVVAPKAARTIAIADTTHIVLLP
jgi:hypothetical protein